MKKSIFAVLAVSVLTSTFSWAGTVERALICEGGIGDDSKKITISISNEKINSISLQDSNYKYDFNNKIAQNSSGQVEARIDSLTRSIEGSDETMTNINLAFTLVNSKSVGQLLVLERFTSADDKATAEQVRVLKCK